MWILLRILGLAIAILALAAAAPLVSRAVGGPIGAGAGAAAGGQERHWVDDPAGQLVFFAVLEGLYLDGVQQEVVEALLAAPGEGLAEWLFVPGCPICAPAEAALHTYRNRGPLLVEKPGLVHDTFGPGLAADVAARLASGSRPERLAALRPLVQRWVTARMDRLRLTDDERANVRHEMEDGAKQGGTRLRAMQRDEPLVLADWKDCAVCDGATDACRAADGR